MDVYLPIAGSFASIPALLCLGGIAGFLSGLFGFGGGFLLTPLLILIGIPPTVAAASDANQLVAASASGCYAHFRAGNVDFRMGTVMLLCGLGGSALGVWAIKLLNAAGRADLVITLAYVVLLGGTGTFMFFESLSTLRGQRPGGPRAFARPSRIGRFVEALPLKIDFPRSRVTLSVLVPAMLGTLVGLLAAVMGVGGGFLMVPVMIYLLRMPMHVVVGTSLFQVLFTCANVTVLQSWVNHTVDVLLALMLLLGSVLGTQLGARAGRRLKADQLKLFLSLAILAVMAKMLAGLLEARESLAASTVRLESAGLAKLLRDAAVERGLVYGGLAVAAALLAGLAAGWMFGTRAAKRR